MSKTRIELLEDCVSILEITANSCYSVFIKKDEKSRTFLLKTRDKINQIINKEKGD